MAHACDKDNDKWICTEGTAPTQINEENDGSIQREMEIKIKFNNIYYMYIQCLELDRR